MTLCGRMKFRTIRSQQQDILVMLRKYPMISEKELRERMNHIGQMYTVLNSLRKDQRIIRIGKSHHYKYYTRIKPKMIDQVNRLLKKKNKNYRILKFLLMYVKTHKIFGSREIARAYLKRHPEMNGYKNYEQENLKCLTRTIGRYFGLFQAECNVSIQFTRRKYKYTKELENKILDLINCKIMKSCRHPHYNNEITLNIELKWITQNEFKLLCKGELDDQISFLGANKPDYHFKQLYNEVCCND